MSLAECRTQGGNHLNLVGVAAQGVVQGTLLDMTMTQTFRNPEQVNVEVVYTFPLPFGAVLLDIEAVLNGQQLKGVVTAKAAAREAYEVAVSEGNTSILMAKNHDGSYTLELGNLLANEDCTVTLKYAQVLRPEQDSLRLMVPCTIAPRFGDAVAQGKFEPHAVPAVSNTTEYPFDIRLTVKGEMAKATVGSPSHAVSVKASPQGVLVQLGARSWLDRDFVLVLSELSNPSCALVAPDHLHNGDGVVMASLTPAFGSQQPNPISLKVLVDCSGSMAGDSIEAAKRALRTIVNSFTSDDWFTLSRFGNGVRHRSNAAWAGGPAARSSAMRWVDGLLADMGGTEMNLALTGVMALQHQGRADVLLITDGEVHAIDAILATARSSGHRFFVVGIGSSPSEGLLRRLGSETGGACEFVAAGESAEPAVLRMFHRLRGPAMTDLSLVWRDIDGAEPMNELPRSVFDGDTVTVFARLSGTASADRIGSVELHARHSGASGTAQKVAVAELTWTEDPHNTMARLAAETQYNRLIRESQSAHTETERKAAMASNATRIAERYQLVTDTTNFVLVHHRDAGNRPDEMPELRQVAGMLAAGWSGMGQVTAHAKIAYSIADASDLVDRSSVKVREIYSASTWRTNRASPIRGSLGDDDFLPSFSKQSDRAVPPADRSGGRATKSPSSEGGQAPKGVVRRRPNELIQFLKNTPPGLWPTTFESLVSSGLGQAIANDLAHLDDDSHPEHIRVLALLLAVLKAFSNGWREVCEDAKAQLLGNTQPKEFEQLVDLLVQALGGRSASLSNEEIQAL